MKKPKRSSKRTKHIQGQKTKLPIASVKVSTQTKQAESQILQNITGVVLGTLAKPEKPSRWRWQVAHKVLRRYRGKNSIFFLIRWSWYEARHIQLEPNLSYIYILLSGKSHADLKQLTGIYRGLYKETNKILASAASVEIAKAIDIWEKKKKGPYPIKKQSRNPQRNQNE